MAGSVFEYLTKIAGEMPAEPAEAVERVETYRCDECHSVDVAAAGDLCQRCADEWKQGYRVLQMAGRCANGAERDHGTLTHAVVFGSDNALCGAKPGRRSVGWVRPVGTVVTCPRCLKRLGPTPTQVMSAYLKGTLK